jgi:4-amino-4-deoxy-L-arabinose transferase-like glycosyltransferase
MKRWLPLLLLLPAALYLLRVRDEFPLGWDHNLYAALARNLVEGAGYSYQGVPHIKYPPGYPVLLMPMVAAFGLQYRALAVFACLCTLGALFAIHRFVAPRHGVIAGVCVAGVFGCQSLTVLQSAQLLSDLPFTAMLFLALDRTDRWLTTERPGVLAPAAWMLAAIALRLAGLALVPGLCLAWLVRRQGRPRAALLAAVLGIVAVPVAGWFVRAAWVRAHAEATEENLSYEQELVVGSPRRRLQPPVAAGPVAQAVERVVANAPALAGAAGDLLAGRLPGAEPGLRDAARWVLLALLLVALAKSLPRTGVADGFLWCYAGVLLLWPWPELMDRFLLPVLPLLVLMLWQLAGTPSLRAVLVAALLALQVEPVVARLRFFSGSTAENPMVKTLQQAADWIVQQAPPASRVVGENAPWLHLKTGRTCRFPPVVTAEALLQWLRRGDLMVVQSIDTGRVNAAMAMTPDRFRQRFATRGADGTICLVVEVVQ